MEPQPKNFADIILDESVCHGSFSNDRTFSSLLSTKIDSSTQEQKLPELKTSENLTSMASLPVSTSSSLPIEKHLCQEIVIDIQEENIENQFLNLQPSFFHGDDSISNDSFIVNTNISSNKQVDDKLSNYLGVKQKERSDFKDSCEHLPETQQEQECHNKVKDYLDKGDHTIESENNHIPPVDSTHANVIKWFQRHQLLKREMKCDHCEDYMDLIECDEKSANGFIWKCKNHNCVLKNEGKSFLKSVESDSIFVKSELPLVNWYELMNNWSKHIGLKATSDQLNIKNDKVGACYRFFREVIELYFKTNPIKMGGPGIALEIDTFSIKHVPNFLPEILFLCIVNSTSSPSVGYMEIIEKREISSLMPKILKVVQPGSIIHSQDWKAFCMIQDVSDTCKIENHSVNFVDNCCVEKTKVVAYWNKYESSLTAMRSSKKTLLNSLLQEFMWRERFSDNPLNSLCRHIALLYYDESIIDNTEASYVVGETSVFHSGDIEENVNLSKAQLEENRNISEDEKFRHIMQQEREFPSIVTECTDIVDEPEGKDRNIPFVEATTTNVIKWLQHYRLLKNYMICDHCSHYMTFAESGRKWDNGYIWRCKNKDCPAYKNSKGCGKTIRAGSFFANSKLPLKKWYDIMYFWSKRTGAKVTSDHVKLKSDTVGECYSFFRETCKVYFKKNPVKIGGPGMNVEIDLFILSTDRKFIKRNKYSPYVVCIIDTNCPLSVGYMEMIETNDITIIFPILLKVVKPGSTIHSKDWREFHKIQDLIEKNETWKYSVTFEDVNTKEHGNAVEAYWNKHKSYYIAMKGQKRDNINSYLQEFMWHERFPENTLETLCQQLANQYSDSDALSDNDTYMSNLQRKTKKKISNIKVKVRKNSASCFLEEPPHKKFNSGVKQGNQSVVSDIKKGLSAAEASHIDETKEEINLKEQFNDLADINDLVDSDLVDNDLIDMNTIMYLPESQQQGSQVSNTVNDYNGNQESELKDNIPLVAATASNVIKCFLYYGLLKSTMKCDHCKLDMAFTSGVKRSSDGCLWKCQNRECPAWRAGKGSSKTIRSDSFLSKSKLSLPAWYNIMNFWSMRVGSKVVSEKIKLKSDTVGECYSYFREICELYFKSNPVKLGGLGKSIEIDTFSLSNEPKGKKNGPWVLCIINMNYNPSHGYMEMVEIRDEATIFPILVSVVELGSIIYTRKSKEFKRILDTERDVSTPFNFMDIKSKSSEFEQTVERYWAKHKVYWIKMRGTHKKNIRSHLQEFMWRERFSENTLECLCQQIAFQNNDAANNIVN